MPQYIYINDSTEEVFEVIQTMSEEHVFFDPNTGEKCRRVFSVPNASVDSLSNTDPFDIRSQVDKTGKMKGTMGDLFNASKEMSERRAQKIGAEDPIKRKYFNDYEKRNKVKHFHDRPDRIEKSNVSVSDLSSPFKGYKE